MKITEIRKEMEIRVIEINKELKVLYARLDKLKKIQIKNDKNKNN